ncbi:MAG: IS1595 family transposase [Methylocystis sp.]
MATPILKAAHFQCEEAAFAYVEAALWPNGPVCPHCGATDRISKMQGKSTRIGLHKCYHCRKPFTVRVKTIFESSHIPLHLWLQAIHLLCSSKKGISSNQLHRTLGITLKSAWFLSHRIREAMRDGSLSPMGGNGGVVEIDETYIGKASFAEGREPVGGGPYHKRTVVGLVERGGKVRTFHAEGARSEEIAPIVRENLAREAKMMTDESRVYTKLGREFSAHFTVNHKAEEYARYTNVRMFPMGEEFVIHTNTIEGYFSIFKRGMKGIYQHCAEKHLHRYLAEYDFRYSNRVRLGVDDTERANRALLARIMQRK